MPWLGLRDLVCVETCMPLIYIFKIYEARDSRILYPKRGNLGYKKLLLLPLARYFVQTSNNSQRVYKNFWRGPTVFQGILC